MIPVFQEPGDMKCFCACIASIFEIPLNQVPIIFNETWRIETQRWLSQYNLFYMDIAGPDLIAESKELIDKYIFPHCGFHLISGMSSRNMRHSVVAYRGEIVHDPYPGSDKVITREEYGFFISLNPKIP